MNSLSVTIQMKVAEQYFPVILFIMLHKVVLIFESLDSNKSPLCFFFFWAVQSDFKLICDSVDKILKCNHSNKSK